MKTVLTVDTDKLTAEDIVTHLKFLNEFDVVSEKIIQDRLLVQAARRHGMEPGQEELQRAADDFRRYAGLHRARDTQEWLQQMGVTPDDFELFLKDLVMKNKMLSQITDDQAIEAYFAQHSLQFDAADLKHILLDSLPKAKEVRALLDDDPEMFDQLVLDQSIDDDTKYLQGRMMHVRRGTLVPELEAQIFNAKAGDIVGPIKLGDSEFYEVVLVTAIHPAVLNDDIRGEVGLALRNEWFAERTKNVTISVG